MAQIVEHGATMHCVISVEICEVASGVKGRKLFVCPNLFILFVAYVQKEARLILDLQTTEVICYN